MKPRYELRDIIAAFQELKAEGGIVSCSKISRFLAEKNGGRPIARQRVLVILNSQPEGRVIIDEIKRIRHDLGKTYQRELKRQKREEAKKNRMIPMTLKEWIDEDAKEARHRDLIASSYFSVFYGAQVKNVITEEGIYHVTFHKTSN